MANKEVYLPSERRPVMKCPKCGFDNLDNATFCIKCGARLDEKIPCPKCGEYIPNDAEFCPHCGKAIPHKSQSIIEKDEKSTHISDKIARVFNRVSTYITLFMFIAFIGISFANHLGLYDTFKQFASFADLTTLDKSMLITKAFIFVADFAVTIVFAILGLIKCHRAFKDGDSITKSYKYLGTIIAAKILTTALILACQGDIANWGVNSGYSSLIGFAIAHLSLCLGFDCFRHFQRGKISIFVARIILAFSFYLPLVILAAFGKSIFSINTGFMYHYISMLVNLIEGGFADGFISNFVVASISFLLAIAIIVTAYTTLVFFITSYFKGMSQFKRFRIIFYMAVITLSILAMIYFVSSIVEFVMYQSYIGQTLSFGSIPVAVFIYTAFLVGIAAATVTIYNRSNRRASLEEKTTIVE